VLPKSRYTPAFLRFFPRSIISSQLGACLSERAAVPTQTSEGAWRMPQNLFHNTRCQQKPEHGKQLAVVLWFQLKAGSVWAAEGVGCIFKKIEVWIELYGKHNNTVSPWFVSDLECQGLSGHPSPAGSPFPLRCWRPCSSLRLCLKVSEGNLEDFSSFEGLNKSSGMQ